jgi:hypothetical protein
MDGSIKIVQLEQVSQPYRMSKEMKERKEQLPTAFL